jgi:hypothetical protein
VAFLFAVEAFAAGEKVFEYSFGSELGTVRELQTVPAVDHDGTIFLGGKGAVGAVTAAGEPKWQIELSPGSQADIGGITIAADRIYVTSTQGLYSFDKTGATIWTNSLNIRNSKVALDGTNNLYVVDSTGILRALREDGSERWTNSVEATIPLFAVRDFGPVVGPNGMIFTMAGNLVAFSGSGQKLWAYNTGTVPTSPIVNEDGSVYFSMPLQGFARFYVKRFGTNGVETWSTDALSGGSSAPPVVGPDKTLYVPNFRDPFGPNTGGIMAFADNGQFKWSLADFSTEVSPAVAEDGTIYVASNTGVVMAVNSNGSRLWSYTNGMAVVKGLTIGIDGSVLLAQTNGTLLALAGTSPVANRVWPVYGRDPRQTSQQRAPVTLTVLPVEQIGTNSALFRAEINPAGNTTRVYFEYSSGGPTFLTPPQQIGASNSPVQFSQNVAGLDAGKLYTVRAVSSNAFGISRSEFASFRTLGEAEDDPPTLATLQGAATGGGTVKFSGDGVITISSPIEFTTNAVLDANGHRVVLTGNGQSSLLRFAPGVNVTLKGLSLLDGRAGNDAENGTLVSRGGALVNNGGTLTLIDCTLSNNVAHVTTPAPPGVGVAAGGAIWQSGGSLVIENCRFLNNSAAGNVYQEQIGAVLLVNYPQARGGAIYLTGGSAEITNTRFDVNHLFNGRPAEGAAVYLFGGAYLVSSSTLTGNSANTAPRGGAIYLGSGTLTLTNSTLAQNTLAGSIPSARLQLDGAAVGAGLFNGGTSVVWNTSFLTNTTVGGQGGGGFGEAQGPSAGAGVYNAGSLSVVNSTFSGNSSIASFSFSGNPPNTTQGEASAIYSTGVAGITNSTVAWNTGSIVSLRGENSTNLVLKNTLLVAGRLDATAIQFIDAGHNMSSDAAPFSQATSRSNVNARLGPIGYYGGETLVYPLAAGSPAINAADDAAAPPIDQRGRTRPFGPHADIGSFESSPLFFLWGQIRGFHDPSTTLSFGTNSVTADTNGFFTIGPLPEGTNEITIAATNALFLPNPWRINVQADQELNAVTSFRLHTLTFYGIVTTPPTFETAAFILAGLPGEKWRVDMSTNLETWIEVSTYTLNQSGLAEIRVPASDAVFLRATAVN